MSNHVLFCGRYKHIILPEHSQVFGTSESQVPCCYSLDSQENKLMKLRAVIEEGLLLRELSSNCHGLKILLYSLF